MRKMVKASIVFLGIFFMGAATVLAQEATISGKVIDNESKESIPFATVVIKSTSKTDGTSTDDNGGFDFDKLKPGKYKIVISYIGFEDKVIEDIEIKNGKQSIELGAVSIGANTENLEEVTITGTNKTAVTKIDRKTFSANDFATAKGGNASDILGKLPNVNVTPDGNISVRGTEDFMVYLNGKPTNIDPKTLLSQISANDIEKIDVITVPTARYNAQGKGGIINIKTKSKGVLGLSGSVTGTLGGAPWANKTDRYSGYNLNDNRYVGGVNLAYNTKKYSIHGSINYNEKNVNGMRIGKARVLVDDMTNPDTYYHMNAQGERPEWYKNFSVNTGVDFYLSESQELSFSYFYGDRNEGRAAYYNYNTFDGDAAGNKVPNPVKWREERYIYNPNIDNRYGDYHTFSTDYSIDLEDDASLKFSGTYESSALSRNLSNTNYFYDSQEAIDADISNNYKNADSTSVYSNSDNTPLQGFRFSTDYEKVLENGSALGVGAQVESFNIKGDYKFQNDRVTENLDNSIDVTRNVFAGYVDYSGDIEKFTYNFGVRTEYGAQNMYLANTSYLKSFGLSDANNYAQYKLDFFPSAHMSYQVTDRSKYILAASRRINRPSLTKMAPFLYRRHFEVYVIGDPTLRPEYMNNVELSYDTNIGKQNINITGFYRGTENQVFRVNTTTTAIQNPEIHDLLNEDVLIRSYTNAGNSTSLGAELTANLFVSDFAKFLVGGSLYNYQISGEVFGAKVDQNSTNWTLKANANFDTSEETSLTFDYNIKSATVTSQGSNEAFQMANVAFSYTPEKLEGWSFNLRGLDLLSSNLQGLDTNALNAEGQQIFYQETEYHRNGPIVEIGATYTFNKKGKKGKKAKKRLADQHFK